MTLRFRVQILKQHDIEIELESMDKNGSFVCHVYVKYDNLSERLLEKGLASLHPSAERFKHFSALAASEQKAKDKKLGIFANYDPDKEAAAAMLDEGPSPSAARKHGLIMQIMSL